jgi:hypothetical protein
MLDRNSIDAMKKVMAQLNNVEDRSTTVNKMITESSTALETNSVSKHSDPSVQAMANILSKFQKVTLDTKETLQEESKTNVRTRQLLNTEKTNTGVRIADYHVLIKETEWAPGKHKNVYDIVDLKTNEVLYQDLALFESAAAITKQLISNSGSSSKCKEIYEADKTYANHLYEASVYTSKIKRTSDLDKRSIYESRYTQSRSLAKDARTRILKSY